MYTFAVPPIVLYVAEEVTGLEGNSATLQFSIARASPPVQPSAVRWYFQPTGTNNSVDITQRNSLPDGSSSLAYSSDRLSLTVGQITQQADGLFTLSATNPAGTASNSTYLIVEGKLVSKLCNAEYFSCDSSIYVYVWSSLQQPQESLLLLKTKPSTLMTPPAV